MSLQNSRELSGMSVIVNGHEIGVDRVANTCNPIKDFKIVLARGLKGVGIDHISKTGTSGNVDTYTIYFTDGTTTTYEVTNGDSTVTVDDEMSLVSENPVQNKVITAAINAITAADVGAVAKTGDTMTGDLELSEASVYADSTESNMTYTAQGVLDTNDVIGVTISSGTITLKKNGSTQSTSNITISPSGYKILLESTTTGEVLDVAYNDTDYSYTYTGTSQTSFMIRVISLSEGSVYAKNVIAGNIEDTSGNVLGQNKPIKDTAYIAAASWSASADANGYFTYYITGLQYYDTYLGVDYSLQPANPDTVPTSAEQLAFALIDLAMMADGLSVNTMTLYAKTKPTTNFYINIMGFKK